MTPIKAIIFDFGGVFYHIPDMSWISRWLKLLGIKDDGIISSWLTSPNDSEFVRDVMTGRISEADVWKMAAEQWHINVHLLNRIRKSLISKKRFNQPLAEYLNTLRPKYHTAILSNAGTDARDTMMGVYDMEDRVDTIIISAEEGMAKPDHDIYRLTVDRIGIQPEEAVFIDDMVENVESARLFGLNAVHFRETRQAISEIEEYLS